jgi:hypothetical protein
MIRSPANVLPIAWSIVALVPSASTATNVTSARPTVSAAAVTIVRPGWRIAFSRASRWRRRSRMPIVSINRPNHSLSGLRPAIDSGNRMFSSALSTGSRLKVWKMKPTRSRRSCVSLRSSRSVSSTPSNFTEPEVGRSRPARMCISVDLPEPDGPMIAAKRPLGKSTLTSASASTAAWPSP